jgi:hypothetical protein
MMACRSRSDSCPHWAISSMRRLQARQTRPLGSRVQMFWQGDEIDWGMRGSVATSWVQGESLITPGVSSGVLPSKYGSLAF